eukprot:g449.t1
MSITPILNRQQHLGRAVPTYMQTQFRNAGVGHAVSGSPLQASAIPRRMFMRNGDSPRASPASIRGKVADAQQMKLLLQLRLVHEDLDPTSEVIVVAFEGKEIVLRTIPGEDKVYGTDIQTVSGATLSYQYGIRKKDPSLAATAATDWEAGVRRALHLSAPKAHLTYAGKVQMECVARHTDEWSYPGIISGGPLTRSKKRQKRSHSQTSETTYKFVSVPDFRKLSRTESADESGGKKAGSIEALQATIANLEDTAAKRKLANVALRATLDVATSMTPPPPESDADHLNERLEIMQQDLHASKEQFEQSKAASEVLRASLEESRAENAKLQKMVAHLETKCSEHSAARDTVSATLQEAQQEISELQKVYAREMDRLKECKAKGENDAQQLQTMKKALQEHGERNNMSTEELATTKARLDQNAIKFSKQVAVLKEQGQKKLEDAAAQADAKYAALQEKCEEESRQRKILLNKVQDLKGSIRVIARVRPPKSGSSVEGRAIACTSKQEIAVSMARDCGRSSKAFVFDSVFDSSSTQSQVFGEVSPLIHSALDGYTVSVLAYGQTGSGKTYTMQGTTENPGINIQALHELFKEAESRRGLTVYEFEVSMLEIYNEKVRDLLSETGTTVSLRETREGKVYAENLCSRSVDSMEAVLKAMEAGAKNRAVSATSMNAQSSRSHMVFTITVKGTSCTSGQLIQSSINLIDLAGSERVNRSGVKGERMTETQNINKSLSALGDVISCLQKRSKHVPFRNSKLTYLLKPALTEGAKVIMVFNISPGLDEASESLCTLKFAERTSRVALGAVKRGLESRHAAAQRQELRDCKNKIARLQAQIQHNMETCAASASKHLTAETASAMKRDMDTAKKQAVAAKQSLEDSVTQLRKLESKLARSDAEKSKMSTQLKQLKEEVKRQRRRHSRSNGKSKAHESRAVRLEANVSQLQAQVARLTRELQREQEKSQRLRLRSKTPRDKSSSRPRSTPGRSANLRAVFVQEDNRYNDQERTADKGYGDNLG